ncbi:methyltransferase domain-containing protein [Pyxidicoccus sp. 3LG]
MITEIEFPEEFASPLGLQPKRLRDLRSTVVLAGPNGAGKSRYLQLVAQIVAKLPEARNELGNLEVSLKNARWLNNIPPEATPIPEPWKSQITKQQSYLGLISSSGGSNRQPKVIHLSYPGHEVFRPWNTPTTSMITSLMRERGRNWDPRESSPATVDELVKSNIAGGFNTAMESAPAYLYTVALAIHESAHPRAQQSPGALKRLDDARSFNVVLRALLSAEIEPELDDNMNVMPRFRGRRLQLSELSVGEHVLMSWAILLHRQREWLQGAHLLIDEPENHLHPDVCLRALDALQRDVLGPEGQIWLATHSVPLIAHAGMESVYFVDNGSIEYAGNKIEKVIDRLLGGEEGRSKLRTLLADANELAFDSFAAQCLLPPGVASAREGDPQQEQMVRIADAVDGKQEGVRILDFAAGRGRLAAALRATGTEKSRRFTYYAYQDPRFTLPDERRECAEQIRQLEQPEPVEAYLVDTPDRLTVPGAVRMDLVVMCNVLHEIPVKDWLHAFRAIHSVLEEEGRLVIMEDQVPSVGELPHDNGYVILHDLALMELFGSKDAVTSLPSMLEGRLTAFAIPRRFLLDVTPKTIGRALHKVMSHARDGIRRIRDTRLQERSFKDGRRHAHFTLLYANAMLALEEYPFP